MNDFYKLAFSLGVPIVIEPEWSESQKLWSAGEHLWAEGFALRDKGTKFQEAGNHLISKANTLYRDAVDKHFGRKKGLINWKTGEVAL